MEGVEIRRAVVFPGQGTGGGEVSGEVREAVRRRIGDAGVPYQLSVFASSVDLLYNLRNRGVEPDVVAGTRWENTQPRTLRGASGWTTGCGSSRRGIG